MKTITVSIIIPAYNEERHLGACLQSIANQTILPEEVIVVDNNSNDRTAAIARQFKFVTLVSERQQGLIAARNTGFNAAKGDILGRINADAVLDAQWVARLKYQFGRQPSLAAIGGLGRNRLGPGRLKLATIRASQVYCLHAEAYFGNVILWGANMAIRRRAWLKIKTMLQTEDDLVHEDQDISLCLSALGLPVIRDNQLLMTTDENSYYYFPKMIEYFRRRHATRDWHLRYSQRPYLMRLGTYGRFWRWAITAVPMALFIGTSPLAMPFMQPRNSWRNFLERI